MSYGVAGGGGGSNNLTPTKSGKNTAGTGVYNFGTTVSGRTIALFLCYDPDGGTSPLCSDNLGNMTNVAPKVNSAGSGAIAVWVQPNITGGANHTFTFSGVTLGASVIIAMEWDGALAASYDSAVNASVNDTATPYTLTSGTPAQAFEAVLVAMTIQNGGTFAYTFGGSWVKLVEEGDNNSFYGMAAGYILTTTAAAQSISATVSGGTGDVRIIMTGIKST
jgi:hypothetical protein